MADAGAVNFRRRARAKYRMDRSRLSLCRRCGSLLRLAFQARGPQRRDAVDRGLLFALIILGRLGAFGQDFGGDRFCCHAQANAAAPERFLNSAETFDLVGESAPRGAGRATIRPDARPRAQLSLPFAWLPRRWRPSKWPSPTPESRRSERPEGNRALKNRADPVRLDNGEGRGNLNLI